MLSEPLVAVITALPTPTDVTTPLDTVATLVLELVQVALVTGPVVLLLKVPVKLKVN